MFTVKTFEIVGKEKMLEISNFAFFHNVFYPSRDESNNLRRMISSAKNLELDKSKILSCDKKFDLSILQYRIKALPQNDDVILSKLKAFTDNNLNWPKLWNLLLVGEKTL